jgi:fatty acid desaturase
MEGALAALTYKQRQNARITLATAGVMSWIMIAVGAALTWGPGAAILAILATITVTGVYMLVEVIIHEC